MELLKAEYGIREIMFYDDVITARHSHIAGICEEIMSRGLKVEWESPARVDNMNKELLSLMRRAGCVRLRYGIESGDEGILKLMKKKINLPQVKEVLHLTKKAGIETFGYFMIGYAHETETTIQRTIDFAVNADLDLVMFTVVTPCPHTPLYELAQKEGLIHEDYWREFTLGNKKDQRFPHFFPAADEWVNKAYRQFYFRPKYIAKKVAELRSFNQITKYWKAFQGVRRINRD